MAVEHFYEQLFIQFLKDHQQTRWFNAEVFKALFSWIRLKYSMFPCDEANETSFNTMDHINPTLMSDNPPITPAGYPLTSAHSSPLNLFPSPPPSSRSPLVDTIPLN